MTLSGPSSTVYTITIKGEAGYGTVVSDEANFTLTIHNPCIDPNFISIVSKQLMSTEYVLFEYPGTGYTFGHDAFDVVTLPYQHDMCGELTYLATFMSSDITSTSQPMSYDTTTREFNIYAEPFNLIGIQMFTVRA